MHGFLKFLPGFMARDAFLVPHLLVQLAGSSWSVTLAGLFHKWPIFNVNIQGSGRGRPRGPEGEKDKNLHGLPVRREADPLAFYQSISPVFIRMDGEDGANEVISRGRVASGGRAERATAAVAWERERGRSGRSGGQMFRRRRCGRRASRAEPPMSQKTGSRRRMRATGKKGPLFFTPGNPRSTPGRSVVESRPRLVLAAEPQKTPIGDCSESTPFAFSGLLFYSGTEYL